MRIKCAEHLYFEAIDGTIGRYDIKWEMVLLFVFSVNYERKL